MKVGWDEATAGERRNRVSVWEIEPVTAPFFICPTTPFYQPKRSRQGMLGTNTIVMSYIFLLFSLSNGMEWNILEGI